MLAARSSHVRRDARSALAALGVSGALVASACGGIAVQREHGDDAGGSSAGGGGTGGNASSGGAEPTGGAPTIGKDFTWSVQFGSPEGDRLYDVGLDGNGDVYVVGATRGAMAGFSNSGHWDTFTRKYDSQGGLLWSRQFEAPKENTARALAVDENGNAYLAGNTQATLSDSIDVLVTKYDAGGHELWTRIFGTWATDEGFDASVNNAGDVYVVGRTEDELLGQIASGGSDAFVRKYDSAGNELWTRQFGTDGFDAARAVTVDPSGDVYITGGFHEGSALEVAFLRKVDAAGMEHWTQEFGDGAVLTFDVCADGLGNVHVAGRNAVGLGGGADAHIQHFYATGTSLGWSSIGTELGDGAVALGLDLSRSLYVAGRTEGALQGFTSRGSYDAFVLRYDPSGIGREIWQFGTEKEEVTTSVAASPTGGAYVVGYTYGAFPGHENRGDADAFLVKLDP